MQVEFPRLADTLVEGVVSAWYKQPGDRVRRGEALFAVETDKINTDVEAPFDGVLAEIVVPAGETALVGAVLARFAGEVGSAELGGVTAAATAAPAAPHVAPPGEHTAVSRPIAAPAAPSGNGLSPMRKRIAERMTEARATIAQGSCARRLDVSGFDRRGRTWTAYFVKAFAQALDQERIGVAIAIPGGLLVPVVPNARSGTLDDIAARIADFAARARDGALGAGDMGGAAATITNVGGSGTLLAFPLVPPGEPAILAPGAIVDGQCWVALCFDRARYDEYAADELLAAVVRRFGALRDAT
jgi:pyruvate/2-oxoglutarate dehydrogenase complex dihydrolipoamide acyltransferase (E2) component